MAPVPRVGGIRVPAVHRDQRVGASRHAPLGPLQGDGTPARSCLERIRSFRAERPASSRRSRANRRQIRQTRSGHARSRGIRGAAVRPVAIAVLEVHQVTISRGSPVVRTAACCRRLDHWPGRSFLWRAPSVRRRLRTPHHRAGRHLVPCVHQCRYVRIRRRNTAEHREWMLRAAAGALGISMVRVAILPLDVALTPLGAKPEVVFLHAFWIGWGISILGAEWWIRRTRPPRVSDHLSRSRLRPGAAP